MHIEGTMVKVLGQVHMVEMLDMVGMEYIGNIVDMGIGQHGGHVILGGHVRNGGHGEHGGHDGHR